MAGNRLIFEVVAEGKNLKVVQQQADDIAGSVERADGARKKAGKGQDSYNKKEKAIHQSTLSSGRQMSKLNQTIGSGSSGLVGAYAVLAANVFAATAAFNTLRRAAQFETMIAGLEEVGAAAGRNLTAAADRLRDVTDQAISAEASVRTMALGISAGFRTDQMEKLAKIAKGASLALGRDMTDALDRLTRGTAKLEPEILDELGIMVRLDDATLKYATTLGKSVADLTQFERRQAFLNATLEQGEKKFGQLAEAIDVNVYDQLGASFEDLTKSLLTAVNDYLKPFIELLVNNQRALITTLALFASTIVGSMAPALMRLVTGFTNGAAATAASTKANLDNLKTTGKLPAAYMKAAGKIKEAGMSQKQYDLGMKSLNASLTSYKGILAGHLVEQGKTSAAYKGTALSIREVTAAKVALTAAYNAHMVAQNKQIIANGLEAVSAGALITGIKDIWKGLAATVVGYFAAAKGAGLLAGSWAFLKTVGMGLVTVLRGIMALLLGPWGIAIGIAAGLIYTFWDPIKKFFGMEGPKVVSAGTQKIVDSLDYIKKTAESFNKTITREGGLNASAMVAGFGAVDGIISETISNLRLLSEQSKASSADAIKAAQEAEKILEAQLDASQKRINRLEGQKQSPIRDASLAAERRTFARLQSEVANATAGTKALIESTANQLKSDMQLVVSETIKAMEQDPVFAKFTERQVSQMKNLLDQFSKGEISPEKLEEGLKRIQAPLANVKDGFEGAQDALSQWNQAVNKLATKDETPFDGAIDAADALSAKIQQVREGIGPDGLALGQKAQQALIDSIREQTGIQDILGIGDVEEWVESLKDARAVLINSEARIKKLQTQQKRLQLLAKEGIMTSKLSNTIQLKEESIRKQKLLAVNKEIFLLREIAGQELKQQENRIAGMAEGEAKEAAILELAKSRAEFETSIGDKTVLRNSLIEQQISMEERLAKAKVDGLAAEEAVLKLKMDQQKAAMKLIELSMERERVELETANANSSTRLRGTRNELSPAQEFNLAKKQRDLQIQLINKRTAMAIKELQFAMKRINADTQLQLIRMRADEARAIANMEDSSVYREQIKALEEILEMNQQISADRINAAREENKLAKENLDLEILRMRNSAKAGAVSAAGTGETTAERIASGGQYLRDMVGEGSTPKAMEAARAKALEDAKRTRLDAVAQGTIPISMGLEEMVGGDLEKYLDRTQGDFINTGKAIAEAFDTLDLSQKFEMITESMQPMIDAFREMGAEGVAIAEGLTTTTSTLNVMGRAMEHIGGKDGQPGLVNNIGSNLKEAFKGGEGAGEAMSSAIQGVAGVTTMAAGAANMLFATQKMAADAAIARIDNEIKAEMKRDGKSAASVARIKKLEAEKEKQKRKSFEADKKSKMAQVVMSTAMAVMQAFAMLGPIGGAIMSAFIIAMGAKQLSIISSMQYQGGGTASKGGSPPSITQGERQNKVDVSGSNAAGELAYMRGERGSGTGASDFTPAFSGRYRATGGAAYMVGEQGPEVFVPKVPGRIVSNDDMREGGGTPINATFNINTIDASNMEQTLTAQRGNIIGMIREAANQTGESFLESVDTLALGETRSNY